MRLRNVSLSIVLSFGADLSAAQSPPKTAATAGPLEAACSDLSKKGSPLSGKRVILYARHIRSEGSVTATGYVAFGVYACVNSQGVSPDPVVLFAVDSKTAKTENPEHLPPAEALWRMEGTLEGSATIDSSTSAQMRGDKQAAPVLTKASIAAQKGK